MLWFRFKLVCRNISFVVCIVILSGTSLGTTLGNDVVDDSDCGLLVTVQFFTVKPLAQLQFYLKLNLFGVQLLRVKNGTAETGCFHGPEEICSEDEGGVFS